MGDDTVTCCDIVCRREAGRAVVEGVPHAWVWHSPAGFEWGYGDPDRLIWLLTSCWQRQGIATSPPSIIKSSNGAS